MAQEPKIKSYEQYLGEMIRTYTSKVGINDVNAGGAMISYFEAMAQALFRSSGDSLAILRDFSLDRAQGDILKRIAKEERIIAKTAKVGTGSITVTDSSFTKISTKVFAGGNSVNVGSSVIKVSDASAFPVSGNIYIGRGTSNVEGPLPYSSVSTVGTHYEINLSSPTTKFHNVSESVVLSQGGIRNITTGTIVSTKGNGAVSFAVTKQSSILDGEDSVIGVKVAAQQSGEIGNVPANSITSFNTSPFLGAVVTNPIPITNGRNTETETELRNRVKKSRQSKGLGTKVAIKNAVDGAQSPNGNATVTSTEIFTNGNETDLFIDNGEGYEEVTLGVGQEVIVDSALGGEARFQLATGGSQAGIAKASLSATIDGPYSISGGDTMAILVGGVLSEHTFVTADFANEGFVTSFEIAASINSNSNLLFSARTISNGARIIIDAKSETNEFLKATAPSASLGVDVSKTLAFTSNEVETIKLYKNNIPLSRSGRSALIQSQSQTSWASTIANGETLIVSVDKTAQITYTFTDADFQNEGNHTTVNKTNSLQSWVNVMNSKMVGITAAINGDSITLSSNLGTSSRASVSIDIASTLVSKGVFSTLSLAATGAESDYILSTNTAQLRLTVPLLKGDRLTVGTDNTNAQISSNAIVGGVVSVTTESNIWFLIDDKNASIKKHGVVSDSLVDITKQGSNIVRFKSNVSNAFSNISVGDYFIVWSDEVNVNSKIEGKVLAIGTQVNPNDYFEFELTTNNYANIVPESSVIFKSGLVFLQSSKTPQKIITPSGVDNINNIANNMNNDLIGGSVSIINDENFIASTDTVNTNGSVLLVTFNNGAKSLGFTEGDFSVSRQTHFAVEETSTSDNQFPLFVVSSSNSERDVNAVTQLISEFISTDDLSTVIEPNENICFTDKYLTNGNYIKTAQEAGECVQIDNISTTSINIDNNKLIKRILNGDRFYVSRGYDLSSSDRFTAILDGDASNKTFTIPLFRNAKTNNAINISSVNFNAFDTDAGATEEFKTFFGNLYSFKNYKAFMKARNVINPNTAITQDAVLFRSATWGKSGERIKVGYTYPTVPNSAISDIKSGDVEAKIKIQLKSGASIISGIDGTTTFDVTVSLNTPAVGIDEMTFNYNGTGTSPALGVISIGDYVTVNQSGEFNLSNTGTFRVSALSPSSFTVRLKSGVAVVELAKTTLTNNTITFFSPLATTALDIVSYVNINLPDYFTAELVDDTGLTGSGVISVSTEEDNGFSFDSFYLLDGINYISSNDMTAISPSSQFTFKTPLQMPSFNTSTIGAYSFNNGEDIRLVPTTAKQIKEFISTLAVSGVSTVSDISISNREDNLQLSTKVLGGGGSIKVTGGSGNDTVASVLGASVESVDKTKSKISISKSSSDGFHIGQYVKVIAVSTQNKSIGLKLSNNISITPNSPTIGKSKITLGNKTVDERFFGQPRNFIRTSGTAFHVEKQGILTYISWDSITGSFGGFLNRAVDLNQIGNITVDITKNTNTGFLEIALSVGVANFSEISEGDVITVADLYSVGQNVSFNVIGISDDKKTVAVEDNGSTAISSTMLASKITAVTQLSKGDIINLNAPFDNLNRGSFKVIEVKNNGFYIENKVSKEERVILSDSSVTTTFDNTTSFDISITSGSAVLSHNGTGLIPNFASVKVGDLITIGNSFLLANRGVFMVSERTLTSITFLNANAVSDTNITNAIFSVAKGAMSVDQYENSLIGDSFSIAGEFLGVNNKGVYTISEVLDRKSIVVDSVLEVQTNVVLASNTSQVSVIESQPYSSYKRIDNKYRSTVNADRSVIVVDGREQVSKINELAGTNITAIGKLNFSQNKVIGIDAYRYYGDLLAEVNRIVYGDPRDEITYEGVAAAGAEIFIKPSQIRRIKVSVNIRVSTGIPFNKIADQARNNIAALINSTSIGKSIAISDIIASVSSISGVKSVAISSPQYDAANDVIFVSPFEKPFILEPTKDIIVSKIG